MKFDKKFNFDSTYSVCYTFCLAVSTFLCLSSISIYIYIHSKSLLFIIIFINKLFTTTQTGSCCNWKMCITKIQFSSINDISALFTLQYRLLFWATVCKTVQPYAIGPLSVLSVCLSVTFVHCGQTVRRIKTKLGMQVHLGLGHIVLDGDPAPLPQRCTCTAPQFSAHICCGQMAASINMSRGISG